MSSHFCEKCGAVKGATGGVLRCAKCGLLGLNPCSPTDPPLPVKCPQRGCGFATWQNQSSDNYLEAHLVHQHPRSQRAKALNGGKH